MVSLGVTVSCLTYNLDVPPEPHFSAQPHLLGSTVIIKRTLNQMLDTRSGERVVLAELIHLKKRRVSKQTAASCGQQ